MAFLRQSLIRIAHKNPETRKHLVPLLRRTASPTVFAGANKRSVMFWLEYPINSSTSGTHRVMKFLQDADQILRSIARKAYTGNTEQAAEISGSTQFGHLVEVAGRSLFVFTEFGKDGPDRSPSEIRNMLQHLKSIGTTPKKLPF